MTDTFENFNPFDVIPSDWASRLGDAVDRLADNGSAGQVLTKTVNGQGVETYGWSDPATEVVADYQPPYVSTFGANGVTTSFTIAHNLGTTSPHVTFWEPDGSGGYVELFGVKKTSSTDGDSLTALFSAQAPATGTIVNISIGGGKDAPIINVLAAVADAAALPGSGNTARDARLTLDNKHLYVWNGASWDDWGNQLPGTVSVQRLSEGGYLLLNVNAPSTAVARVVGESWATDPAEVAAPAGHTIGAGQVTAANTFDLDFDTDDIVWFLYDGAENWEIRYSSGAQTALDSEVIIEPEPIPDNGDPGESTTIAPDGVTALEATPGPARVTLTWEAPASMGSGTFFRYKIDYREAAGTWLSDQVPNVAGLTATVTGLTNDQAYEFRVRTATTVASTSTLLAATVTATPVASDQPASLADQTIASTGYTAFKTAAAMDPISPALGSVIAGDLTAAYTGMQDANVTAVVLKPRSGAVTYTIPAPTGDVFDHIKDHLELALATADLGTIEFTNTTYTIGRAAPIKFEGFTDVEVDLNGATIELTEKALGFRIEDCNRFSIGNGTLTGVGLLATIATVNIDGSGRPEFIVDSGYVADLVASAAVPTLHTVGLAESDGAGGWRVKVDGYAEMFVNRGNATNNYSWDGTDTFLPTSAVSNPTFVDGAKVLLLHENNTAHAILLHNEIGLTDISIHDLEMVNIPGMSIVGEVDRGLHIDAVTTTVASGALLACSSDGVHINGNGGDIVVENCVINQNWDDKINIKGNYWRVVSIVGLTISVTFVERTTSVRNWGRDGDELILVDGDYDVIASMTMSSDATETSNNVHSFTVDSVPGSVAVGMLIGNVSRGASRVVVRNNTFFETRAQGVLVQSSNVIVADNRFEGIASPAIKLNLALHLWYEAINVDNVLIDGNEFKRCSQAVAKSNDIIYVYQVDGTDNPVPVIGNVELVDNALLADITAFSGTTGPQ